MSHILRTTLPADPLLDLAPWVGQRQASFRFELFNGVSGLELGEIHPLRTASLTHDTSRTIKRQLSLDLGVADTAAINTITDRVRVFMTFPNGSEYPLGTYMFTDDSRQRYTSGDLGNLILNDEMFLVDQQITTGLSGTGTSTEETIQAALAGLPVTYTLEGSQFQCRETWSIGTNRGVILEALCISGDYFSPWFGNDGQMHFIRTFDPADRIPDFDFDAGHKVVREPILLTNDLITAPNRFVVISNNSTDPSSESVGTYDVPHTAPYSIAQRGFVIAQVSTIQLTDSVQAAAVARGLGIRQTVFERVGINTAPDPRHDSYNVIRWQGDLWLELAWSMALTAGGEMSHLLRKAYTHHE